MKLVMITLEGTAGEVAEVGLKLGVSSGSSVTASVVGAAPTESAAASALASTRTKPLAKGRGRGRGRKKDAAPPPEPSAPAADEPEDDDADEAAGDGSDGTSKFPVSAAELMDAKRLHHIVDRIMQKGVEDVEEIVAVCEGLKDQVPLLGRVKDLSRRVRSAYDVANS